MRNSVNFNPYSGPSWTESTHGDGDDERGPLLGDAAAQDGESTAPQTETEALDRHGHLGDDSNWGHLDTTGAFEVNKGKRIGKIAFHTPEVFQLILLPFYFTVSTNSPLLCFSVIRESSVPYFM